MRIFTLNCFGLPFFARNSGRRMRRIAALIEEVDPDIVCLQEVFYPWHKNFFEKRLETKYPHRYVPRIGMLWTGGGLCFFSKTTIATRTFQKYRESGYLTDWTWVHRINAQGFMQLEVTASEPKVFFHSHLTCNFRNNFDPKPGSIAAIQRSQLDDLAGEVQKLPKDRVCLFVGDLNVPSDTELFREFAKKTGFVNLTESKEPSVRGVFYPFKKYFSKLISLNKIDHVLWRGPAPKSHSWRYLFDDRDFLSDHAAIVFDFEV